MKKSILFILTVSFFLLNIYVVKAESLDITKNARATIMVEPSSGEILYKKNVDKEYAVASLTKLMSLLLFFENIESGGMKLEEKITVSKNAKEMGGTQIYLETGEQISISDLLKGITMASANDATVALAERVSGTEEAFVFLMNKKAKDLNLKHTQFKNSTGLDEEGHFSSAFDLAIIAMELLKHEQILSFTSIYEDYIRNDTDNKTWVVNTNKLVRFYNGADGLKTGYTDNALSCMAATAKRNDLRLLVINLGYEKVAIRNEETIALLDYGFNIWKANTLLKKGKVITNINLDNANKDNIPLILKEDVAIITKKTDIDKNKYDYKTEISKLSFPINKGDVVGYLVVKDNNDIIKKVPLTVKEKITKANILKNYFRNFKSIILGNI